MALTSVPPRSPARQRGATMFITVMLVLVLLVVAVAVFQQSGFDEKSARGQYDRQVATQAAELAMRDAEMDLACLQMPALNSAISTPLYCTGGALMARQTNNSANRCRVTCGVPGGPKKAQLIGFGTPPADAAHAGRWAGANASPSIPANGNMQAIPGTAAASPAATRSNWADSANNIQSVALGTFTGTSAVPNVSRQPRYMIEGWDHDGSGPEQPTFRITAKGWGRKSNTEITLQQVYRP